MKSITMTGFTVLMLFVAACKNQPDDVPVCQQWLETEITLTSSVQYNNPYTDVDIWVEFSGPDRLRIHRPAFWYGDSIWKVRFASPVDSGLWHWKCFTNDTEMNGQTGVLEAKPYTGNNPLIKNGLLRMSPGKRNVVHANGKPFLVIGDTPWGLPWRGTVESVTEYARNRRERGFNAALLMSLMPDQEAYGPRSRTVRDGFDVAFEDLSQGHIKQLNPEYFQTFDTLRNILIAHGIVPVFQPVFHGFGWKGLRVLGENVEVKEYILYCRYLVARYGAGPAFWLVGADSDGRNPGVFEGGEEIEAQDAYAQPTGIHYSPFCKVTPDWWNRTEAYIPHENKTGQDESWLDFQWCQTGHSGEHQPWKVAEMYNNRPVKAVANGEPTYEGIRDSTNGSGWWQGHEAWLNFTSGGTMGVVYGAGGLWNWKLFADERGWADWANTAGTWRDAIELPGAWYVGYLGKALKGLDITDIEKHHELADGHLCVAKPGELYIVYMPEGGALRLAGLTSGMEYRWFDPQTGEFTTKAQTVQAEQQFATAAGKPQVLIVSRTRP